MPPREGELHAQVDVGVEGKAPARRRTSRELPPPLPPEAMGRVAKSDSPKESAVATYPELAGLGREQMAEIRPLLEKGAQLEIDIINKVGVNPNNYLSLRDNTLRIIFSSVKQFPDARLKIIKEWAENRIVLIETTKLLRGEEGKDLVFTDKSGVSLQRESLSNLDRVIGEELQKRELKAQIIEETEYQPYLADMEAAEKKSALAAKKLERVPLVREKISPYAKKQIEEQQAAGTREERIVNGVEEINQAFAAQEKGYSRNKKDVALAEKPRGASDFSPKSEYETVAERGQKMKDVAENLQKKYGPLPVGNSTEKAKFFIGQMANFSLDGRSPFTGADLTEDEGLGLIAYVNELTKQAVRYKEGLEKKFEPEIAEAEKYTTGLLGKIRGLFSPEKRKYSEAVLVRKEILKDWDSFIQLARRTAVEMSSHGKNV